ncbi:radical SAM domain heme biosynthesis protein [Lachnospiraceae bacterium KM106-2]|nr:radical SAM domain heme biosynthesis protein [Lachnospiraceae bacterium KM106-2]
MMENQYLSWKQDLTLNPLSDNIYELFVGENKYYINGTAAQIIRLYDGTRTQDEIMSTLSNLYKERQQVIQEKVLPFVDTLCQEYQLELNHSDCENKVMIHVEEQKKVYPHVASIELTEACNLRCKHCYGSFGESEARRYMKLEIAKKLLDDLNALGVVTIELTGGDITVYPFLQEIIEYALTLDFTTIALLTNGVLLSQKIIDLVLQNKERFLVQIDLHGLSDEYLEWFTGVPNTLDRIQNNIKILAEHQVKMRVSTIVTKKNYQDISKIAEWVHQAGGRIFGISPVINLGRAKMNEDLLLTVDEMHQVNEQLEIVNQKYPNFISIVVESRRENTLNCGCLTSHVVISARGNVKICTMDSMSYFNSVIGNVFENSIRTIFDKNMQYVSAFSKLKAPDDTLPQCKDCSNLAFCNKCILRGLISAKKNPLQCAWYQEVVTDVIKQQIQIE